MTRRLAFVPALLFTIACGTRATSGRVETQGTAADSVAYDSALASALGADELGMHNYVMAFLKAGPKRASMDSATSAQLLRAHLANIQRLARMGKLVLAGPFADSSEFAGIYVFDVATLDEAKALTETDPAVKAGRFVMELHPWYGTAALMQVNSIHRRIQKKSF